MRANRDALLMRCAKSDAHAADPHDAGGAGTDHLDLRAAHEAHVGETLGAAGRITNAQHRARVADFQTDD